jgi:hypothetical protein
VRTAVFVVAWWLALTGWWIVAVGTNAGQELIAAVCAGLLGAAFALALRGSGQLDYRFEARWVAKAATVPWKVLQELGIVFWALALHLVGARRVTSRYRAFPFPAGGNDPTSAGRRAVASEMDALSPNTMPVDVDCERGVVLRHELDPRRAGSEMP